MERLLSKYAKYLAYGVLGLCIILMGYILYEITLAKQRFADQLISKSITQTESELDSFFERVHFTIDALQQQYQSGFWNELDRKQSILHSISLIESYPPVSSIGIADRRGFELNVIPDSTDGQWLTRNVFVDRWGYTARWQRWKLDGNLELISQWEDSLSIDTRDRPWYQGAIRSDGEVFWTNPYVYTTGPLVGITASRLVQQENQADSLSKIIAFDLTLDDLNEFVGELDLTSNQNIFLLTGDKSKVIAFREYSRSMNLADIQSALLLSPEEFGNRALTEVISEPDNNTPFRFTLNGDTWWGIEKVYPVTGTRNIRIVSVLPESDFALEINYTLWVIMGSFLLIILLSVMVVLNHNKLHRVSNVLTEKNKLISEQKRFLFSEVHHRVKNNLALISAFLELDQLNGQDLSGSEQIKQILKRIKVISLVQETGYQSEALGLVPMDQLATKITSSLNSSDEDKKIAVSADPFLMNINLALSYGLLINELIAAIKDLSSGPLKSISVAKKNGQVITTIGIKQGVTSRQLEELLQRDIIRALLLQLEADTDISETNGVTIRITFENKEKKGIVGHRYY